jgi:hypothetical protein
MWIATKYDGPMKYNMDSDAIPKEVPCAVFKRILGNLVNSGPVKRGDERTGEKKQGAMRIPSKPPKGRGRQ